MMDKYISTEVQRARSLKYYYEHRTEQRAVQEKWRRTHGVPERAVKRSREDRLTDKIQCRKCGSPITAPSNIVRRYKYCSKCRHKAEVARNRAKGLTTHGTPYKPRIPARDHVKDFKDLKEILFCGKCGNSDAECLDFHHRDPLQKSFTIASRKGLPLATLIDEMLKCDVLCANCHRKEHAA